MSVGALGRVEPPNFDHVAKYPLTLATIPAPPTPITIGINWYTDFDSPVQDSDGQWWLAPNGITGTVRGGHCTCLKPDQIKDAAAWWDFYNQGAEGACVGFGSSRYRTLLTGRKFDARWLWDQAKLIDPFPDTNPGDDNGTTVNAGMAVLRSLGHVPWSRSAQAVDGDYVKRDQLTPDPKFKIATTRWATTVDQMRVVLSSPENDRRQAFRMLNSWGRGFPHGTWLPYKVMERLLAENAEAALDTVA